MELLKPDSINFADYEWQTDCRAKVRPVADFAEALCAELEPAVRDSLGGVQRAPKEHGYRPGGD